MSVFRRIVLFAFLVLAVAIISCSTDSVQVHSATTWPESFGFGRLATSREIDSLDIDVSPDGAGLPRGAGRSSIGKEIYGKKCAVCHGETGTEGPFDKLVAFPAANDSLKRATKAIGTYWPYATTLYDYINRAMPYNTPGTLTPDEVYSLTAFLLHMNGIIDSTIVIDERTLPLVEMPARNLFVEDDRRGGAEVK